MVKYLLSLLIISISLGHKYVYGARVKRCANLFDEGCINGGIIGSGTDELWISGNGNTPGKRNLFHNLSKVKQQRCANVFDESCINDRRLEESNNKAWLLHPKSTTKKENVQDKNVLNLLKLILKGHSIPNKRCANLLDESCINGGIVGSGDDEEWLTGEGGPGRR